MLHLLTISNTLLLPKLRSVSLLANHLPQLKHFEIRLAVIGNNFPSNLNTAQSDADPRTCKWTEIVLTELNFRSVSPRALGAGIVGWFCTARAMCKIWTEFHWPGTWTIASLRPSVGTQEEPPPQPQPTWPNTWAIGVQSAITVIIRANANAWIR